MSYHSLYRDSVNGIHLKGIVGHMWPVHNPGFWPVHNVDFGRSIGFWSGHMWPVHRGLFGVIDWPDFIRLIVVAATLPYRSDVTTVLKLFCPAADIARMLAQALCVGLLTSKGTSMFCGEIFLHPNRCESFGAD